MKGVEGLRRSLATEPLQSSLYVTLALSTVVHAKSCHFTINSQLSCSLMTGFYCVVCNVQHKPKRFSSCEYMCILFGSILEEISEIFLYWQIMLHIMSMQQKTRIRLSCSLQSYLQNNGNFQCWRDSFPLLTLLLYYGFIVHKPEHRAIKIGAVYTKTVSQYMGAI